MRLLLPLLLATTLPAQSQAIFSVDPLGGGSPRYCTSPRFDLDLALRRINVGISRSRCGQPNVHLVVVGPRLRSPVRLPGVHGLLQIQPVLTLGNGWIKLPRGPSVIHVQSFVWVAGTREVHLSQLYQLLLPP